MVFIFSLQKEKGKLYKEKEILIHMIKLRDIITLSISTAGLENYVFKVH